MVEGTAATKPALRKEEPRLEQGVPVSGCEEVDPAGGEKEVDRQTRQGKHEEGVKGGHQEGPPAGQAQPAAAEAGARADDQSDPADGPQHGHDIQQIHRI